MRIQHILSTACIVAISLQGGTLRAQGSINIPGVSRYTPWEPIKESNISFKKRVWRDLDSKDNRLLFATDKNVAEHVLPLAEVLMDRIMDGSIQAYKPINDRFTEKMSYEEILKQIDEFTIINKIIDPATGEKVNECVDKNHILSAIHQYRIKEDWLTLKDNGKVVVRIVGIAPVVSVTDVDGITTDRALFWVFYPDHRKQLADYFVPATAGAAPTYTWDEFFEGRHFNSKTTRVTETDYSKLLGK